VRSRWVTITGGGIMLLLGLLPKMAALVEAVPLVVLGGAGRPRKRMPQQPRHRRSMCHSLRHGRA
jgi:hypothetical protein